MTCNARKQTTNISLYCSLLFDRETSVATQGASKNNEAPPRSKLRQLLGLQVFQQQRCLLSRCYVQTCLQAHNGPTSLNGFKYKNENSCYRQFSLSSQSIPKTSTINLIIKITTHGQTLFYLFRL